MSFAEFTCRLQRTKSYWFLGWSSRYSSNSMDRTQMMKTVESLRDQLRISRMPVSICSNELKEYCTQNGNKDPLIHPPERRENPFAEKPKCTILWQCYCDGSYIGEKNFLKKKKTFSQCVIIRNCNSSLLDGNLTIVNRDRKGSGGKSQACQKYFAKALRCSCAKKKNKKGRNKQAAFSCVCTTESVLRFIFLM